MHIVGVDTVPFELQAAYFHFIRQLIPKRHCSLLLPIVPLLIGDTDTVPLSSPGLWELRSMNRRMAPQYTQLFNFH